MHHAGPDDITRELTIRTLRPGGVLECTTIHPITEQDAAGYHSLGSVSATDLGMLLAKRQLIHITMPVTRPSIEKVLNGPTVRLSVHQPGNVSVYCSAESVAKRIDPNALATIFCRKHGSVGVEETVFGWMVITCDAEHEFELGAPRWVLQDLMDMLPAATELADAGGIRVLN